MAPYNLRILLVFTFLLNIKIVSGQNFNYSVEKDSLTFEPLDSSSVILASNSNWNDSRFVIHLPFSFNFCGSSADSLLIEGSRFLIFNEALGLAFVAFNGYGCNKDTNDVFNSSLSYKISGSQGNRICKIQFSALSQNIYTAGDQLTFQIWIYENQQLALYTGPNAFIAFPNQTNPQMIGMVNRKMNGTNKGYLVSGHPGSPSGQVIGANDNFAYVNSLPAEGIIYRFIQQ